MRLATQQKQAGMTMWGIIFLLSMLVFFGYIIMQLVPVYSENSNVKNAMEVAFDNSGNVRTVSKSSYLKAVQRQLYLDGAHKSVDFKKDLNFKRDKKGVTASIAYERIVPLFHNINLMVDFDEAVTRNY